MESWSWTKQWLLATVVGATIVADARAEDTPPKPSVPVEAAGKVAEDQEEAAIRATIASYVEAFNRADAARVADHWSDQAEYINPLGEHLKGRDAIAKSFQQLFTVRPGIRLEVPPPKVRRVTPDVAIEEGKARVTVPGEPVSESEYLAVHVKKDGKWKLDSVREMASSSADEEPALEDIEWLVGEWADQEENAVVRTQCAWSENKAFLVRSFTVIVEDLIDLHGTQIIGFDASLGKIRSWVFDSDGGFSEGTWTRKGNRWFVRQTGTLPDGRKATSINIMTRLDDDRFTLQSIGREVGGEVLPNLEPVTVIRGHEGD